MARSVSEEFKAIWQRKVGTRERRRIAYKRRYWNGSAFVNESSYSYLYESDFISWGDIPNQLDSPQRNVFSTSIVTLRFNNSRNEWIESTAPPSFFAADENNSNGYRLHKSIFQLQVGYVLHDDTTEWVAVFTGIALKQRLTAKGAEAEVQVASKNYLLDKSDASQVGTTFTLEDCSPATGDGSNTEFRTTSIGVDHLTAVQVNAVAQTQGSSWRLEDTNIVAEPGVTGAALITFTAAPGNTLTVKCSGLKWYQNQTVETLIGLLCDQAGITSSERTINPAIFPGGVSGSQTIDTQAQWQAGSVFTNTEADISAGNLRRRWFLLAQQSGVLTSEPVWNLSGTWTQSGGKARCTTANGYANLTSGKHFGSWEANIDPTSGDAELQIMRASVSYGGGSGTAMYTLLVNATDCYLYREDHIASPGPRSLTELIHIVRAAGSSDIYRVTRTEAGDFSLYINGTLQATASDSTYGAQSYWVIRLTTSGQADFDNIYWSEKVIAGSESASADNPLIYESQEFDLLAAPTAWGTLDYTHTLNGGSITYKTAVSETSGAGYDAYVAIGSDGVIQSALKRYLKIKAEITPSPFTGQFSGPEIDKLVANFSTSSVFVALANFSGKTCSAAIQRLAQIADYEIGFDGDGDFFFRSKTVSASPTVELTQENGIIDVMEYDPGTDYIRNVGSVRSGKDGQYYAEYDGADASEASPTSEAEYGRIAGYEDYSDVLLSNDANLSTARSRLIYENNYLRKQRIRAQIWNVPWLEVGDNVELSVFDHPLLRELVVNDPLREVGSDVYVFGETDVLLAREVEMKVLEYKPNYDTGQGEVLLEKIL